MSNDAPGLGENTSDNLLQQLTDITPEQIKRNIQKMKENAAPVMEEAEKALDALEEKRRKEALGLDVPFDIKEFVTKGSIAHKGLEIVKGTYTDMHSLTKRERILAESIVYERSGKIDTASPAYGHYLETAMMALAITRMNDAFYPTPDRKTQTPETFKKNLEGKLDFYDSLLDCDSSVVSALVFIYDRLAAADVLLKDEDTKKKS